MKIVPQLPLSAVDAYARCLPAAVAIRPEAIRSAAVDPVHLISVVTDAAPQLEGEDAMLRKLISFDYKAYREFDLYARGLTHAHSIVLSTVVVPVDSRATLARGIIVRTTLQSDVTGMIGRGQIAASSVAKIPRGRGFEKVASGIYGHTAILRAAKKDTATPEQLAELDGYDQLAAMLLRCAGARTRKQVQQRPEPTPAEVIQKQFFTLLLNTYEEVRAGLTFIHRKTPSRVEAILPSVYKKAPRQNTKAKTPESEAAE